MKSIKTKTIVEGIKVLDKSKNLSDKTKNTYVKTKDAVEESKQSSHSSPVEYAVGKVQDAAHKVQSCATESTENATEKVYRTVANKSKRLESVVNSPNTIADRSIASHGRNSSHSLTNMRYDKTASGSIYTKNRIPTAKSVTKNKSIKGIDRAAKTVKTTRKSIKTATRTGRQTIKTAKHTAHAAQKSAKVAVKTARATEKVAKVTAQTAIKATKLTIKATIATVKAIIAATKALVAAIVAGGWVAVIIILLISMVAAIVGSAYGIFFAGEASTTGQTINSVISEIDSEYTAQLDSIISSNSYDLLDMSGSRALWKHVLAVYTVAVVTDPDNPMEVVTMDNAKAQILRNVFWSMNTIHHEVVKYEVEVDILDEDGLPTGETDTETTTVLRISVVGKSIDDISAFYNFNTIQLEWLDELLKPEYHSLWNSLLYGITSIGDGTLVEIAQTQIGNVGGEIYWRWYGFSSRVSWCAVFISWVADQAGYLDAGIIPRFSSCAVGIQWFKVRGQWQERGYTPSPGDLIFFDWELDGRADHVGIVERVEGGYVYTIEGNSSDSVRQRSYPLSSDRIFGYGVPRYD